ncbi:sigma-70 family RNA polymerase sigma factor [Lederbergia citrisecunda]|uniref:sigma-70 family RNA polymerase sigma factor n=1 Tax=Lederbergia citrisecunda TaxID=2833583 RepID=UPI003D28DCD8
MHDRKVSHVLNFEDVLAQYEPMISANIRQLNIYRDHEQYRQAGRVALWQAWNRFDEKKGDFTPYAFRSIRGALLDELKRESRLEQHVMPAEDEMLTLWIGADDTEWDGSNDRLHHAISWLTNGEKELLQWLFIEGLTQADCAKRAGISVPGIKKRRERLLKKLREMLEREGDGMEV